jgi:hypothetical protein
MCSPPMLPVTFQFLIAMSAYATNERMARRLDYVQEEAFDRLVLTRALTGHCALDKT